MDGHAFRSRFLRETVDYGVAQDWLYEDKKLDEDDTLGSGRGQWSALTYRLTKTGKKHFEVR